MSDISNQLVEQVQSAIADKQAIRIEGGGTKSHMGRAFDTSTQVISTAEHTGVTEYTPAELIITARAGTSLAEIDAELAKNNQMFAADPRRFGGKATLGGSLAANQSGIARPWFGSVRDHVLGVKLINGKGEHLQFGGQVLKNVAGYDVSRLQAGAMGSLGIMTELSFKILPKPAKMIGLSKEMDAFEAVKLMNQFAGTAKPITGASWTDGTLHIRLEGAIQAVDACEKLWTSEFGMQMLDTDAADTYWAGVREQTLPFFDDLSKPLWRFSVNAAAEPILPSENWLFNWSGSERWLRGDFELGQLAELAKQQQGEVQLYSGGDRTGELFLESNDTVKRLLKNVKHSLDPESLFNPGRLYGWL